MSLKTGLFNSLPAPKYTGEEEVSRHAQRGPRIVGAGQIDGQLIVRRAGPPPYGRRRGGWRPRGQEDFGDGGAFPEIPVAQYPLDMGRSKSARSNALAVTLDGQGRVQYDAIARQGHDSDRQIQASFSDLIPLRQRADAGDIDLSRPNKEQVAETAEKTKNALAALISTAVAAQKPKNIDVGRKDATFVRYAPADQMGNQAKKQERIIKIVGRQIDPMEPGKWKHKKIPGGPGSPPPPVLRSPPRKLTAEDQEAWKIPAAVSNWKNAKGYTVPLDKRVAANGQALQDISISDKHAQLAEAIKIAEKTAREEVRRRAEMQQKLAEKEKMDKAENLRMLAQKAREERTRGRARSRGSDRSASDSRSRSRSSDDDDDDDDDRRRRRRRSRSRDSWDDEDDEDGAAVRAREQARREKRKEEERKLRQSRMGAERRVQVVAREQNRDISEKIALGLAKPTQSKEAMYDSRLFNQTSGFESGFNEDNPYDKPLFEAQNAIASIYRPRANMDDDDDDEATGDREMDKIQKSGRFGDALGRGTFKGTADAEAREGPVQFEKEAADPFNVDKFLAEVEKSGAKRGYGLQESEARQPKRARVEDDD